MKKAKKHKQEQFLNCTYIIPRKGLRLFQCVIVLNEKADNIVFEKDGFALFTSQGRLKLKGEIKGKRRLRRFLRDYTRSQGALPNSTNFWLSGFR